MKKTNYNLTMMLTILVSLLIGSCSTLNNENLCDNITCENEGTCIDGTCDCPAGFIGETCSQIDVNQIQILLDNGSLPLELINNGVPIDSFYGKTYQGGLIFYLTAEGTGMVAATEDQSTEAEWGCFGNDIINLSNVTNFPVEAEDGARIGDGAANTDAILAACNTNGTAAKLCRDLGEEWFLPSRDELSLMYTNLKDNKDLGGFASVFYWSSTEFSLSNAWFHDFFADDQFIMNKSNGYRVRAARAF